MLCSLDVVRSCKKLVARKRLGPPNMVMEAVLKLVVGGHPIRWNVRVNLCRWGWFCQLTFMIFLDGEVWFTGKVGSFLAPTICLMPAKCPHLVKSSLPLAGLKASSQSPLAAENEPGSWARWDPFYSTWWDSLKLLVFRFLNSWGFEPFPVLFPDWLHSNTVDHAVPWRLRGRTVSTWKVWRRQCDGVEWAWMGWERPEMIESRAMVNHIF